MISRRLLVAAGGGGAFTVTLPVFPDDYTITRDAGNPIIDVDDNPNETHEQYVPAPVGPLPDDSYWVYVKGSYDIYAWKSTAGVDGPYVLQNSDDPVIARGAGGSWEDEAAIEPYAVYDGTTIHLYYKGSSNLAGQEWSIGYATADDSDPTDFTKDPTNPIYTNTEASTAIGFNVYDFAFSSVIKIGSVWHFYGYVLQGTTLGGALYTLVQGTMSDWTTVTGFETIAHSGDTAIIYGKPDVFEVPDSADYGMLYTYGSLSSTPRSLRYVTSPDGETWSGFPGTTLLDVVSTSWEGDWVYAAAFLKETTAPFAALQIVDGQAVLFYSGQSDLGSPQPAGHHDNTGLAYLEPT